MGWVMKKILICVLFVFCLVACDKNDDKDYKKELVEYSSEITKYTLDAEMKVVKNETNVVFNVSVSYLAPNYYKVKLQNKSNNNIQIIVKNNDGVFVITPALNKQFQFNSDWPLNSSHAYLLQSIVKDITNDSNSSFVVNKDSYTITSAVNTKTNATLKTQKTTFDKKTHKPISNILYDSQNKPLVTVEFKAFNANPNLKADDFNAELINNTVKLEMAEGVLNGNLTECVPAFMPEGYKLSKSIIKEEYTLFTYANGTSVYTITTLVTEPSDILVVTREFNDLVLLDIGVGFINDNSLSFFQDDLLVTIFNDVFSQEEAIEIANSFKKTNK